MEPRIQYAKTTDGVSIAFSTLGEGVPLVSMPSLPWSHIQREWQVPVMRRLWERTAEKARLIQYDSRGSGLSERRVTDYSLDAHLLDLQAVVDRLGFGDSTAARIERVFRELCVLEVEPDGLRLLPDSVRAEEIRDQQEYGGIRLLGIEEADFPTLA